MQIDDMIKKDGGKPLRSLLVLTSDNATASSRVACCRSNSLCSSVMTNKDPKVEAPVDWTLQVTHHGEANLRSQVMCRKVT